MANTITITGNLVKEPKFQMTSNNKPMVMFTLAENTFHNGKEDVLFWDCFNIGEQAEKFSKDFVKGREYTIYGKAVPNNYEKDGVKHYRTQIKALAIEYGRLPKSAKQEA